MKVKGGVKGSKEDKNDERESKRNRQGRSRREGVRKEKRKNSNKEKEERKREGYQSPLLFSLGLGIRCSTMGCSALNSMQLAGDFVPAMNGHNQ